MNNDIHGSPEEDHDDDEYARFEILARTVVNTPKTPSTENPRSPDSVREPPDGGPEREREG
jgi:hypothetical protein